MKLRLTILLSLVYVFGYTQTTHTYINKKGQTHLLGKSKKSDLLQEPYLKWYEKNYEDYESDSELLKVVKNNMQGVSVKVFMGTWCGDSRREVPRFYKITEDLGIQESDISLINLSSEEGEYKQCPTHEEKGENIHRVPTFIFYRDGDEIGRIVESPMTSFEMDMAQMFSGLPSTPRYRAVTYLDHLFDTEPMDSIQANFADYYKEIFYLVDRNNTQLNTYGNVLLDQKEYEKAILAFRFNANIFKDEARMFNSLANAYLKAGMEDKALQTFEKALERDHDKKYTPDILITLSTKLKS